MRSEPRGARTPVWALPVPLAATPGITFVFFSSGYLDVSVHRVPPAYLSGFPCSVYGGGGLLRRVSPFRYPRLQAHLQLPAAFRSLSRLSSALSAKASTLCSSLLDLSLRSLLSRLAWRYSAPAWTSPARSLPAPAGPSRSFSVSRYIFRCTPRMSCHILFYKL